MLQKTADVPEADLREVRIIHFLVKHQGDAIFPDGLMAMHAVSVVLEDRLRHEGADLKMLARYVLQHVLVERDLVCGFGERFYVDAHFALACRRHLMVMEFNSDAHLTHAEHGLIAEFLKAV